MKFMRLGEIVRKIAKPGRVALAPFIISVVGWVYTVHTENMKQLNNVATQIAEVADADHNGTVSQYERANFYDENGLSYDKSKPIPSPRMPLEQGLRYLRNHSITPKFSPVVSVFG